MQFTLERHQTANLVTAVSASGIRIGEREYSTSLILSPTQIMPDWGMSTMEGLTIDRLGPALSLDPEVLLLGTGVQTRFPPGALLAELSSRRIGFEAMDTASACRTYNVLAHEDRAVVAALIVPAAG